MGCLAVPRPAAPQGPSARAVLLAGASITAGSLLLDDTALDELGTADGAAYGSWSDAGDLLGRGRWAVAGVAVTYGVARAAGSEGLAAASGRVLAGLAAAGVANGILKVAVGRQRPYADDPLSFHPLNLHNAWQSFPSGHAVTAFGLAAAVSEEAGRSWVTVPAFGAAGLVAWSRMHENKHWMSDVVGGATVGIVASRETVRWLRRRAAPGAATAPAAELVLLPRGLAVTLALP